MRLFLWAGLSIVLLLFATDSVHAQDVPAFDLPPQDTPIFEDGFAELSRHADMGTPLESPHLNDQGDIEQRSSTGLAYWLHEQNQPTFTDGWTRSALTDDGLVLWAGSTLVAPRMPVIVPLSPRAYLYATYPGSAPALERIINCESNWVASAKNHTSTASGLAQFLTSTFAATPQGRAGLSIFDPYVNIDAAAWEYAQYGAAPWRASIGCHGLR